MTENEVVERINNEVWATLAPSKIHGIGVVAIRDVPQGTYFERRWEETGLYYELSEENFLRLLKPIRSMILDRTQFSEVIRFRHPNCVARLQSFMNHSSSPNSDGKMALRDIN